MRKLVRDFLVNDGHSVLEAQDGEEALKVFYENPDLALIILDVMMPKKDGYEVLKEIRETSKIPVIMLTAKSDEKDELLSFSLGVDEFVSKPFSPKVLVARVNAILRRTNGEESDKRLEAGGIVVDQLSHRVLVGEKEIELSFKEFELLVFFMENTGVALSREKILNSVWNYDYFGDARTIDTHVKKLRAKLGSAGDNIKTIWGIGYKFEV
ncbi:MAG: response regulator transcription factor [Lachnospiraceae bacterium]|nr:response regulator transcription factor [Lachnospiraceae bacterium]